MLLSLLAKKRIKTFPCQSANVGNDHVEEAYGFQWPKAAYCTVGRPLTWQRKHALCFSVYQASLLCAAIDGDTMRA